MFIFGGWGGFEVGFFLDSKAFFSMTDELCERGWQFLFSLLSWLFSLLLKHCLANDFYETFIISKWASLRSGTIFMINHPARKSPTFIDCLVVRTLSLSLKTRNGRT